MKISEVEKLLKRGKITEKQAEKMLEEIEREADRKFKKFMLGMTAVFLIIICSMVIADFIKDNSPVWEDNYVREVMNIPDTAYLAEVNAYERVYEIPDRVERYENGTEMTAYGHTRIVSQSLVNDFWVGKIGLLGLWVFLIVGFVMVVKSIANYRAKLAKKQAKSKKQTAVKKYNYGNAGVVK